MMTRRCRTAAANEDDDNQPFLFLSVNSAKKKKKKKKMMVSHLQTINHQLLLPCLCNGALHKGEEEDISARLVFRYIKLSLE